VIHIILCVFSDFSKFHIIICVFSEFSQFSEFNYFSMCV
jgi:hypothetical protein